MKQKFIKIANGCENNLKNVAVNIEKGKFTVVTGVSGSGKSSLVYNTLYKESQRLYFSTFPSWSRKYLGVVSKPKADSITGLDATIVIDQKTGISNQRSTAGTFSGIYDMLRLLFSRFGEIPEEIRTNKEFFNHSGTLSRSLFSFNSGLGACPHCKGFGVLDFLDPELVIADRTKSIRERALKITAPNGYIIYSQVTLDVLDTVCKVHGFSIDTPLNELTKEQLDVLFYGSDKIVVPFGKHTLESRMKWVGITVKPREEGHYTGFINVMNDILKRDRNANILRFVRSIPCNFCNGSRLRPEAEKVLYRGYSITGISKMTFRELHNFLNSVKTTDSGEKELIDSIINSARSLASTGLGHITISRNADSLSGGEIQRIRIAALSMNGLSGTTFIFDEPAAGLHRTESDAIIEMLIRLKNNGNTVIAVEHDMDSVVKADNIIETGPAGGIDGGHIIFSGSVADFLKNGGSLNSPTWIAINEKNGPVKKKERYDELMNIDGHRFFKGTINTITGISGSGKRSLINKITEHLEKENIHFTKMDRSPIGRTPRSNPATYTGISDKIRDLFAKLDLSKELGLSRSHFSFNSEAGRCPKCEGAGLIEIGMKYFGEVEILCDLCHGKRFNDEVLKVKYKDHTISDILSMQISNALVFFNDVPAIRKTLQIMTDLGLGYLNLGQTTSSLSGGEAQRIKLATHLSSAKSNSIIILEEPASGLHPDDVRKLVTELNSLAKMGNAVIAIENNTRFISSSGNVIELQGTVQKLEMPENSIRSDNNLVIEDIATHNLKNISLSIKPGTFTVITGVSGSGKTSLAFDTLFPECLNSFLEGYSPFIRSMFKTGKDRVSGRSYGLMPPVGVSGKFTTVSSRSTAGTVSGIYEMIRMLYSRAGTMPDGAKCLFSAEDFSFNSESGACLKCGGTGFILSADIEKLVSDWSKSFLAGALDGTKQGKFYGDSNGQFVHTLIAAGNSLGIDFSRPVSDLTDRELEIALYGIEDEEFAVSWHYARGNITGTHEFKGKWNGFANLLTDEYHRSIGNKNEEVLKALMKRDICPECHGKRLKKELLEVKFAGYSIDQMSSIPVSELKNILEKPVQLNERGKTVLDALSPELSGLIDKMIRLGLGHISMDRPSATLSLGERERLKLVKSSVNSLSNILYIIDEPSRGLHNLDCLDLVSVINEIKNNGNTVIAVEHEPAVIKCADMVIELGPSSGNNGGEIIFNGSVDELKTAGTPTAEALTFSGSFKESVIDNFMIFKSANARNLKNIDISIPIGKTTVITGISGSGKTTLIKEVIHPSIQKKTAVNCIDLLNIPQNCEVSFIENRTNVISSKLATAASFTGLSQLIKKKFSDPNIFSTTGQCPQCKGLGTITIPMDFLADSSSNCNSCEGTGFTNAALLQKYNGLNIAQINSMSVSEAVEFFNDDRKISKILTILSDCGLEYLTLGQHTSTFSTGEIQRLNLAVALHRFSLEKENIPLVFIFDEPSTGLHHADIKKFLKLFDSLNRLGHTVIIAEHRLQIVTTADHVIDLGPGCGEEGGHILFCGSVKKLAETGSSKTAEALRKMLEF